MKKKELGITKGSFSEKDGRVFIEDGTTICYLNNAEFESVENGQLISDAFNTANKCGLLPSELLEQRDALLHCVKALHENKKDLCEWQRIYVEIAINQVEQ